MSRLLSPELLYALQGRFICVDGIDGAGKTTLLANLKAELEKSAVLPDGSPFLYRFVREPGTTPLGEKLREILLDKTITCGPMSQALLFTAARAELVTTLDRVAGETIFCDRWASTTYAYQGQDLGRTTVSELHDLAINREPDLVVILDLPIEKAIARVSCKSADRFESKPVDFFEKASDEFYAYAHREYDTDLLNADCSQEELLSNFIKVLHDWFV